LAGTRQPVEIGQVPAFFILGRGYDEAVRELLSEHDSGEELPLP
jgi:hypothetical protein